MKKTLTILLVATMAIGLVACGEKAAKESSDTEDVAVEEQQDANLVQDTSEAEADTKADTEKNDQEADETLKDNTAGGTAETTTETITNTANYTYTDKAETLYATQKVNLRDLPDTTGKKIGSVNAGDELSVTGQCNETSWYRIKINGGDAYVSNSYVTTEKPADNQQIASSGETAQQQTTASENKTQQSNNSNKANAYGQVTTFGAATTEEAIAAANEKGYNLDTLFTAEDGHQYGYYIESNLRDEPGYMHNDGEWLLIGSHGTTVPVCRLGTYFSLMRIDIY